MKTKLFAVLVAMMSSSNAVSISQSASGNQTGFISIETSSTGGESGNDNTSSLGIRGGTGGHATSYDVSVSSSQHISSVSSVNTSEDDAAGSTSGTAYFEGAQRATAGRSARYKSRGEPAITQVDQL